MDSSSSSNNPDRLRVGLNPKTKSLPSSAHSRVGPILVGHAFDFYRHGRQSQTTQSLPVQSNLVRVKQIARIRRGVNLPASNSEMEASTGRIPNKGEREVQSARPANIIPSPASIQKERTTKRFSDTSPSGQGMAVDETNEAEASSDSSNDSNEPSTTSSEIRRRLGHLSDPRFILANNSWFGRSSRFRPQAFLLGNTHAGGIPSFCGARRILLLVPRPATSLFIGWL